MPAYAVRPGWYSLIFLSFESSSNFLNVKGPFYISTSQPFYITVQLPRPGGSVVSMSGEANFLYGALLLLTSAEAGEKSSWWLWKESNVSTGVRNPGNICVTDRLDTTLAVKVALNPNTTNQRVSRSTSSISRFLFFFLDKMDFMDAWLYKSLWNPIPTFNDPMKVKELKTLRGMEKLLVTSISPFPKMFSSLIRTYFYFWVPFNVSSAYVSNLDWCQTLSFGKELSNALFGMVHHGVPWSFYKRQILDSFKLKEFADNNFEFDIDGGDVSKQLGNTVGKGEIGRNEQYLPFPQCFQNTCSADT